MTDIEQAEAALSTRLTNALLAGHEQGWFAFLGGSEYAVRVEIGGEPVVRSGSTEEMWAWLRGFDRGRRLPGEGGWWRAGGVDAAVERLLRARDSVRQYRMVLLEPGLADQLRILVLVGMEERGLNFKELAELIERGSQSVRDALQFGNPSPRIGTISLFEEMIAAVGRRFEVTSAVLPSSPGPDAEPMVRRLAGARVEPSGFARMRALAIAVERRLVDHVEPESVSRARRARKFTVEVGGETVVRPQQTLLVWLRGLADGAGDAEAVAALQLA